MRKLILVPFLLLTFSTGTLFARDSLAVTYIANCGFLLEMDGSKIVIDGLFKRGHNHYPTPDTLTQKLLVSNLPPFDDLDLILVSHTHEDHFDKDMVLECLLSNPSVKLLCPEQVLDSLRENESEYKRLKSQIIECTPDAYTSQEVKVGNMEVIVCRLAHPGEKYRDTQNNAYLVSKNGKTVFHSSDIDPMQINKYTGVKPNQKHIDIGMINEDFAKVENAGLTASFINARINIAMHLPESVANDWLNSFKETPELFSNPYIFKNSMEKKVFYLK